MDEYVRKESDVNDGPGPQDPPDPEQPDSVEPQPSDGSGEGGPEPTPDPPEEEPEEEEPEENPEQTKTTKSKRTKGKPGDPSKKHPGCRLVSEQELRNIIYRLDCLQYAANGRYDVNRHIADSLYTREKVVSLYDVKVSIASVSQRKGLIKKELESNPAAYTLPKGTELNDKGFRWSDLLLLSTDKERYVTSEASEAGEEPASPDASDASEASSEPSIHHVKPLPMKHRKHPDKPKRSPLGTNIDANLMELMRSDMTGRMMTDLSVLLDWIVWNWYGCPDLSYPSDTADEAELAEYSNQQQMRKKGHGGKTGRNKKGK